MTLPIARFPLPENQTPEGVTCVTFTVPDDPEFISAIIGLVDVLKHSKSFDRDDTQQGAAIVSRVWETALESQPVQVGICGGDDMTTIRLRVKPGYPHISQFSHDSGVTWVDYKIQPHWPAMVIVPIDGWDQAQEEAGAIFRGWHMWLATELRNGIIGAMGKVATVNGIMAQVGGFATSTDTTRAAVNNAYDEMANTPAEDREQYTEECVYRDVWQRIFDQIKDTIEWATEVPDWMTALNDMSDAMIQTLNQAAATLSGDKLRGFARSHAGDDGGEGFGLDCQWTYTHDLTIDMGVFEFDTHPIANASSGEFVSGEGIKAKTTTLYNLYALAIIANLPYPIHELTAWKFGGVNWEAGSSRNIWMNLHSDAACETTVTGFPTHETEMAVMNPALSLGCRTDVERMKTSGVSEFGLWVITYLTVIGYGPNPFVSAGGGFG